jgi:hypothetical protein
LIRGIHVIAVVAILLAAASLRATEMYASRYQSLPAVDWVESRPPLAESDRLPAASDLARGFAQAVPLLTIQTDVRARTPVLGPPAVVQRTVGGVRDAARIEVGTPGNYATFDDIPMLIWLDVIVFNRELRAAGWSELMGRELDIKDNDSGESQARTSGPDEADGVWVVAPWANGGRSTVAGHRGAVGFVVKVFLGRTLNGGNRVDLNARAETVARQVTADWTAWLATQTRDSA